MESSSQAGNQHRTIKEHTQKNEKKSKCTTEKDFFVFFFYFCFFSFFSLSIRMQPTNRALSIVYYIRNTIILIVCLTSVCIVLLIMCLTYYILNPIVELW